MNYGKRLVLSIFSHPTIAVCLTPLIKDRVPIFMLHRLANPDLGVRGHDPAMLRQNLALLRRHNYNLISLEDLLLRAIDGGPSHGRSAVFTIDDGYKEQGEFAASIFGEFDCPATTFVTTGFLDGDLWLWWDQIEYIFLASSRRELRVTLGEAEYTYRCADADEIERAVADLTERCKRVTDEEKHAAITRLAEEAEVEVPQSPPPKYAPMSWDQLRAAERLGMTFGPHTVTHPILSRVSNEQSRHEIEFSWHRLQAEAHNPASVFCYPNGCPGDFGQREITRIERLGLAGAVVVEPDYVNANRLNSTRDAVFTLPRFAYHDESRPLLFIASGGSILKKMILK